MSRSSRHISKCGAFSALHGLKRVEGPRDLFIGSEFELSLGPVIEALFGVRWPKYGEWKSEELGRHDQWAHHDGGILDFNLNHERFVLTVNHYDVERLAAVMIDYKQWQSLKKAFPILFEVSGLREFHAIASLHDDTILKLRHRLSTLSKSLHDLRCVFQVPSPPGSSSFVFVCHEFLHKNYRNGNSNKFQYQGMHLCVNGSQLEIVEGYREGWARQFGENALFILDRFDPVWPRNNWGVLEFERWLESEFTASEKKQIVEIRERWIRERQKGQQITD